MDNSAGIQASLAGRYASALFDLVSAEWIDRLATTCAANGCAALWTLSIDGSWRFADPDAGPDAPSRD